jgi:Cu/Ag efflux protein CusF
MRKTRKLVLALLLAALVMPLAYVKADDDSVESIVATDQNTDGITALSIGALSAEAVNLASNENFKIVTIKGFLIEIGNTTAEQTTVVVRVSDKGTTTDVTIEVPTRTASFNTGFGSKANMSDWIAGDQLVVMAKKYDNSGLLVAQNIRNTSFRAEHRGVNGWIKTIDAAKNSVTVEWGNNIYTVSLASAKIVAGIKNPATVSDLKVGDRVRLRVIDDRDKNPATWKGEMLVVLRRGNDNFMRVTRVIFPAKVVSVPTDLTLPTAIEVEIQKSKFFQVGDVNNVIGEPGAKVYLDISTSTQLMRRFLGKALLSEFAVGDDLWVVGRRDEATGHISVQVIKNDSIQMLGMAQRVGLVAAVDPTAKTISIRILPAVKGQETVVINVSDSTKIFIDGKEKTLADVSIGDVVKAKGTYNRNTKALDAKTIGITSKEKNKSIGEKASNVRDKFKEIMKKGFKK